MRNTLTVVQRILNVNPQEVPRIGLAWGIQALLRIGFVMGWTITLALFLETIGLEKLPLFLGANALLVMGSSLLFSEILKRQRQDLILLILLLTASGLLVISSLVTSAYPTLFIGGVLLIQSILLSQVNILVNLFTEDLFSPLESQRAFPLIVTAETMGGILGGLAITSLGEMLPTYKFIQLWGICLIGVIPLLLASRRAIKKIPSLEIKQQERHKKNSRLHPFKTVRRGLKLVGKSRLLQGIGSLVLVQFMLFTVMEFQYTKAVEQSVHEQSERIIFEMSEYQPTSNLDVELLAITPIEKSAYTVSIEHALAKKLATLQIIFSAGSLLVHLFLTSRILNSLGLIGTLFIHPLISLINCLGLLFRFDFLMAGMTRSSFEVTRGLFHTAYHGSYYVLPESIRMPIKELMDGFIKPLGSFSAFILLFLIQSGFQGEEETWMTSLILITLSAAMLLPLINLQKNYVRFARKQLKHHPDLATRFNAIEILVQHGSSKEWTVLARRLNDANENERIKSKILQTIQTHGKPEILPFLLEHLEEASDEKKLEIVEAMNGIKGLPEFLKDQPFLKYNTLESLKSLLENHPQMEVKKECIHLLATLERGHLTEYWVKLLKRSTPELQASILNAYRKQNDPGILTYAKTLLASKNPTVQAAALLTLKKFDPRNKQFETGFERLKQKKDAASRLATLTILQEYWNEAHLAFVQAQKKHPSKNVQAAAIHTLALQGYEEGFNGLMELLKEKGAIAHHSKKMIDRLDENTRSAFHRSLHLNIAHHIQTLLHDSGATTLDDLDKSTLTQLQHAYGIVDQHEEVLKIETLLNRQSHALPA